MTRRTSPTPYQPLDTVARRSREMREQADALRAADGIRRCAKCLIPETEQTVTFDEHGVCNMCSSAHNRDTAIDWPARRKEFEEIIDKHRGKGAYDAVVPFSGGKDSAWVAYMLVKEFKLKILLATFDSHFRRPGHLENMERVVRALGCDHVTLQASDKVIQKTMVESLKRRGDFCWYCHTGVVATPYKVALMMQVPLVIWGEPGSEYSGGYYNYRTNTPPDERWFNRQINLSINAEDMLGFIEGVDMRDLEPFRLPDWSDMRKLKLESVHLGDYVKWDAPRQYEILNRELGWEMAEVENLHPRYHYEKVECFLQGSRDYLRFIKRGYSRTVQRANLDIRSGELTRQEAEQMIDYDAQRPASLDVVLQYMGIDEAEFMRIAESHQVYPHVHDPANVRPAQRKLEEQEAFATRLLGRLGGGS